MPKSEGGQRRRIVDAVADHRDDPTFLPQFGDQRDLVGRGDLGMDAVDADTCSHFLRDGCVVAGEEYRRQSESTKVIDGLRRRFLDLIGDGDDSHEGIVDGDPHGRFATVAGAFGFDTE